MVKYKYDFTQFINEHQSEIFGKEKNFFGHSYVSKYRKQINALNIKMNEVINAYGTKDKKFLLGLFSMAISQINKMIKPNVKLYEDDFYALFDKE